MYDLNVDFIETNEPGKVRVCCPFCPDNGKGEDEKYHLYANFNKSVFICFRCTEKGRIEKLTDKIGGPDGYIKLPDDKEFFKLKNKLDDIFKIPEHVGFDLDKISYPLDEDTPIAFKYMINRKFSKDEIDYYGLRVGKRYMDEEGNQVQKWAGRIIFPFHDKGEITFLVGRSYTGKEPKYLNSEGDKTQVLYGIDGIHNRECIMCEGIVSSIAAQRTIGIPAIACLGKTITDFQLSKLREKCDTVYPCLDGDVSAVERERFNMRLMSFGFKYEEILLPDGQDPDDLGLQFVEFFKNRRRKINI